MKEGGRGEPNGTKAQERREQDVQREPCLIPIKATRKEGHDGGESGTLKRWRKNMLGCAFPS